MLKKIIIKNYKVFPDFVLELNAGMNVIVGDNDVGKSNLLEAINLALTGRLRGNQIAAELSPFLMNLDATRQYISAMRSRRAAIPPEKRKMSSSPATTCCAPALRALERPASAATPSQCPGVGRRRAGRAGRRDGRRTGPGSRDNDARPDDVDTTVP